MKKFKKEVDFCKHITPLISTAINKKHKFIPEVPRFSNNNHADMLFMLSNGTMFIVEYKLNNSKKLLEQVNKTTFGLGIVNQKQEQKSFYNRKVFGYTGSNDELEILKQAVRYKCCSKPLITELQRVYFWGYRNTKSSLEGGIQHGKRLSFYQLYRQAIFNLQEEYKWVLDFKLVFILLGIYARSQAQKHYKYVIDNKKFYEKNQK